ncbi:zinc finger CCHC domain-containing protein 7 [Betta splendens]|uniref:Zinc finger CCHC domain-containing protein 7 n=1 Tax=Betta splendens TaxID=158456 RepID=A0A6P7LXV5_BETSP|nr:zinc finger CCHC domain-containing protein 7 [Betta splendens]
MYCSRQELENELYQEDEGDSEGSGANSELEFHLYSQLHYSSNPGEMDELESEEEEVEVRNSQHLQGTEVTTTEDGKLDNIGESGPLSLNVSKLHEHLKKKTADKDNTQKSGSGTDSEGQRGHSSLVEEVIVIDSSPDVISISEDDTSEDEGICVSKGQGPRQLKTSTPAQQGTLKRKRASPIPVSVPSSGSSSEDSKSQSESESESESESSDSEALQNWMILGRSQQDGDQSISLNLERGSDSSADSDDVESSWLVSVKDKEAQICNKDRGPRTSVPRVPSRYYTTKTVLCRNCNKAGHLSKNCPQPKKLSPCFLCGTLGHLSSECPNKHCNNCGQPGHLYNACSEKAYWYKQCHRCGMKGHFFDACPEIWRQYHVTTKKGLPAAAPTEDSGRSPASCYNCSRKGHFGHACTQRRMFNGVYPSTPFINHYDTVQDIRRRQNRINLKAERLKKEGYFSSATQNPPTPGPPRKKRKMDHRSNHSPHQTTTNHKPTHVFFTDSDFKDATPKMNKHNKQKQQESSGKVKPWKPKRPVPTSRDKIPPNKIIFDESADFPRGGDKRQDLRKKMKNKKNSRAERLCWSVTGEMQGSQSKQNGQKKKKGAQVQRTAKKKCGGPMYPTDENLFIIKQRRRR